MTTSFHIVIDEDIEMHTRYDSYDGLNVECIIKMTKKCFLSEVVFVGPNLGLE